MTGTMFERLTRVLQDVDDGVASTTAAAWVLRAMRDPTEQMLDAGDLGSIDRTELLLIWTRMIDAALEPSE